MKLNVEDKRGTKNLKGGLQTTNWRSICNPITMFRVC